MFDHVKFGVSDYEKSKTFFLEALRPLGVELVDTKFQAVAVSADITDSEPDWSTDTFISQASDSAMIMLAVTSKITAWKILSLKLLSNSISISLRQQWAKAEVYQTSFNHV